jgi:hypothetical protein
MRKENLMVALASGEFDRRKARMPYPGLTVVARLFKIPVRKLENYRANHISRKHR